MLTDTPLDNTWLDCYNLISVLSNHTITSIRVLRQAFSENPKGLPNAVFPSGHYIPRLQQQLAAMTLARPLSILANILPPRSTSIITFDICKRDLDSADQMCELWRTTKNAGNTGSGVGADSAGFGTSDRLETATHGDLGAVQRRNKYIGNGDSAWAYFVQAQQYTFHSSLIEVIILERQLQQELERSRQNADALDTEEDQQLLRDWLNRMRQGNNYRPDRISAELLSSTLDTIL